MGLESIFIVVLWLDLRDMRVVFFLYWKTKVCLDMAWAKDPDVWNQGNGYSTGQITPNKINKFFQGLVEDAKFKYHSMHHRSLSQAGPVSHPGVTIRNFKR